MLKHCFSEVHNYPALYNAQLSVFNLLVQSYIYYRNILFAVYAVIEVNIEMENVTVLESDPMVEICFSLSSGVTEQVVVTAETRPKAKAADQATGAYYITFHFSMLLY